MSLIKVKYKNEEKEYEKGILISEIAEEYKDDYKHDILVATVDNRVTSLDTKLNKIVHLIFVIFHLIVVMFHMKRVFFSYLVWR